MNSKRREIRREDLNIWSNGEKLYGFLVFSMNPHKKKSIVVKTHPYINKNIIFIKKNKTEISP
jgi:SET domain-containing protein